jgi:glycosyltransferase involved in cell wall biosynthesis
MHVVLLNQAFHPDVVATAQMAKDLADHLVARGHRVSVVASRSIYGQSGASLPKHQTIGGVEVHRVGSSIFGRSGVALRALDFALFYLLATLRTLTLARPDVVIGFTTPPFIAWVGVLARWLRGSRAVYWVMDLYPDVAIKCGVLREGSLPARFFERVSRALIRQSDASVVLGRCMRDVLLAKGAAPDRVRFIPVWAETDSIRPIDPRTSPFRREWGVGDDFLVAYSGNWGIAHDALTICRAMLLVATDPPRDAHGAEIPVRFVFIGGGKRRPEVEAFIRDNKLSHIAQYRGYVPRERIGESLGAADVHLMTVLEGLEGLIVPSKLFGVMAAGRPSLYVGSPTSEIARVLTESGSGLCLTEGDAQGLADAIRTLAEHPEQARRMGAAAKRTLDGTYDAATACRAWADFLEQLVLTPRRRARRPRGPASPAHSPAHSPGAPA